MKDEIKLARKTGKGTIIYDLRELTLHEIRTAASIIEAIH